MIQNAFFRVFFSILLGGVISYAQDGLYPQTMRIISVAPYYPNPGTESLPIGYLNKNDTINVDSMVTDSSGAYWLRIQVAYVPYWINKVLVKSMPQDTIQTEPDFSASPEEIQRRNRAIRDNSQWSRRIKKVIHDGSMCLDMDKKQLIASLGNPQCTTPAFAIGLGNHEIWYFTQSIKCPVVVYLLHEKVIGWSQ